MQSTDLQVLINRAKDWVNPPHPGRGKSKLIGFLAGFSLGALGAGLYLRSLVDALICLALTVAMHTMQGPFSPLLAWLVTGSWVAGRIWYDDRARPGPEAHGTGQPAPA